MSITFVDPTETRRLSVGDGDDFIEVRSRITYGGMERLRSVAMKGYRNQAGEEPLLEVDMSTYNIERMAVYIVGWSARKPDGTALRPDKAAFASLTETAAAEINAALDRHIERLADEEKAAGENPTVSRTEPLSISAGGSTAPTSSY